MWLHCIKNESMFSETVWTILSNYARKTGLENVKHVDTSIFALKTNLASLITEVGKLDIDKLVPVPVDLGKLRDVVKNDVVKKTVYGKLVAKVNSIDISGFVLKAKYDTDKSEIENKIPNTSDFVKKTDYNVKIIELKEKIPDLSSLATKTVLTIIENEIPNISNLVKKTDYWNRKNSLTQKLLKSKRNLLIMIMINILQLQSLTL